MEQIKKIIYIFPHPIIYYSYKYLLRRKFNSMQSLRTLKGDMNQNSLYGFDKYKCIFIHIPKAAGVSLSIKLFGNLGGGHRPIYDYYKIFSPSEFNSYYKFTIVRNPWDRLVSAYYFLKEGGFNNVDKAWFEKNLKKYSSFEDFVYKWVNKNNIYSFTHFIPQTHYLFLNGKLLVDKIYRFEEMEHVYEDLKFRLNVNLSIGHLNKTKKRLSDYRHYYNHETQKIVETVYADDIQLLKYRF